MHGIAGGRYNASEALIPLRLMLMFRVFSGVYCCLPDVLGTFRYTADGPGARSDLEGDAQTSAFGSAAYILQLWNTIYSVELVTVCALGGCVSHFGAVTERESRSLHRVF